MMGNQNNLPAQPLLLTGNKKVSEDRVKPPPRYIINRFYQLFMNLLKVEIIHRYYFPVL